MAANKLDSNTFDDLLRNGNPFDDGAPVFDLSGIEFISPAGMAQLAAASAMLSSKGTRPSILIGDPSVRSYLSRAGFAAAVAGAAEILPELPDYAFSHLRGSNPLLLELTKLETASQLPRMLDQVVWVLRHTLKYKKEDAFDVATAVSEVTQNTFDHNSRACGYVAMQVYGRGEKRFLEIGIADSGVGLFTTLRRNTKYQCNITSDEDAIRYAVKLGVSEHQDPTRGTGLHHLLEITYKHEGAVQIRSGSAKVRYRMDKRQGWLFNVSAMPGVQIALALRTKVEIDNPQLHQIQ